MKKFEAVLAGPQFISRNIIGFFDAENDSNEISIFCKGAIRYIGLNNPF